MNAIDMFKQLGYEKIEFSQILIYISEELREFVFMLESKKLLVRQFKGKELTYSEASITQEEYTAIYKQLKELRWLQEDL